MDTGIFEKWTLGIWENWHWIVDLTLPYMLYFAFDKLKLLSISRRSLSIPCLHTFCGPALWLLEVWMVWVFTLSSIYFSPLVHFPKTWLTADTVYLWSGYPRMYDCVSCHCTVSVSFEVCQFGGILVASSQATSCISGRLQYTGPSLSLTAYIYGLGLELGLRVGVGVRVRV